MKPETRYSEDAAQVAWLLKPPAERELAGSRHQQLKEYLMREIAREAQATHKPRRPRRRLAYFAAPLAAAGAAAVLVATSGSPGNAGSAGNGGNPGGGLAASHGSDTPTTMLGRIADVAAAKPLPRVRDDQFVYVESKDAFEQDAMSAGTPGATPTETSRLAPLHLRQIWLSVNGSRAGLLRENGQDISLPPQSDVYLNAPNYRYLESLPTDPATLLKLIYSETRGEGGKASVSAGASAIGSVSPGATATAGAGASSTPVPSPSADPRTAANAEAFVTIGDLLREQIAPPKVTAALYKAAAMIPGVRVINDATDVLGQHHVAVALDDSGTRHEWLFDKRSLEFAGEQTVALTAGPFGPAGTIEGTEITLDRAIVDHAGEVPAQ